MDGNHVTPLHNLNRPNLFEYLNQLISNILNQALTPHVPLPVSFQGPLLPWCHRLPL